MTMPMLIALNGAPKAGKSTAQTMLREAFGLIASDDGRVLRDMVKAGYGASEAQVTTQDGKTETVLVAGQEWEWRQLLGELGKKLEEMHGPRFIPEMAIRKALEGFAGAEIEDRTFDGLTKLARGGGLTDLPSGFSFGSVRRDQGAVYKDQGGLVVEIRRAGCAVVNDFDRWNPDLVDLSIDNPIPLGVEPLMDEPSKEQALRQFQERLIGTLTPFLEERGFKRSIASSRVA